MTYPVNGNTPKLPYPFNLYDTNWNNKISMEEIITKKDILISFTNDFFKANDEIKNKILDKDKRKELFKTLREKYKNETDEKLKKKYADAIFNLAIYEIKQMPPSGETVTKNSIINVLLFMNENIKSSGDVQNAKSRKPCEWRAAKILAEGNFYGCTELATLFQELLVGVLPNAQTKYVSGFYLDWALNCKKENPDFRVKDAPGHAIVEVTDPEDSSTFFVDPGGFNRLTPKTTEAKVSKPGGDTPQIKDVCDILIEKRQNQFYVSYYKYGCVRVPEFKIGEEPSPFNTIEEVNSHLATKFGNIAFKGLENLELIKKELKYGGSEESYFQAGYMEFIIFDKSDKMPFNTDFGEKGSTTTTIRKARKWSKNEKEIELYMNKLHPAFKKFDKNKEDGKLSQEEIIQSGDEVAKKFLKLDDLTWKFRETVFDRMHLDPNTKKEFLKSLVGIYAQTQDPNEKARCSDAIALTAKNSVPEILEMNEKENYNILENLDDITREKTLQYLRKLYTETGDDKNAKTMSANAIMLTVDINKKKIFTKYLQNQPALDSKSLFSTLRHLHNIKSYSSSASLEYKLGGLDTVTLEKLKNDAFKTAVKIIISMPGNKLPAGYNTPALNLFVNTVKFMNDNMNSAEYMPAPTYREKLEWAPQNILAEGNFNGCTEAAGLFFDLFNECAKEKGLNIPTLVVNSFDNTKWAPKLKNNPKGSPARPDMSRLTTKEAKIKATQKWIKDAEDWLDKKFKSLRAKNNSEKQSAATESNEEKELYELDKGLHHVGGHTVIEIIDPDITDEKLKTLLVDPTACKSITYNNDVTIKKTEEYWDDSRWKGAVKQTKKHDIHIKKENDVFCVYLYPLAYMGKYSENEKETVPFETFNTIEDVNDYLVSITIPDDLIRYEEDGYKFKYGDGKNIIYQKSKTYLRKDKVKEGLGEAHIRKALEYIQNPTKYKPDID